VLGAKLGQDLQRALTRRRLFLRISRRSRAGSGLGRRAWGVELNSADVEIVFETVGLEEIVELEGSDVPAPSRISRCR